MIERLFKFILLSLLLVACTTNSSTTTLSPPTASPVLASASTSTPLPTVTIREPIPAIPSMERAATPTPESAAYVTNYHSVPYEENTGGLEVIQTEELPIFWASDLSSDAYVANNLNGKLYLVSLVDGQVMELTSNDLPIREAVLSEEYVAWTVEQDYPLVDIFVYDRATGEQRRITDQPGRRLGLDIHGSRLVWAEDRVEVQLPPRPCELYGYDNDPNTEGCPPEERVDALYDVYAYDLATGVELPIAVTPGCQQQPNIHCDLVVWQDSRIVTGREGVIPGLYLCEASIFDLYLYDFRTGASQAVVENGQHNSQPSIFDNRIAWISAPSSQQQGDVHWLELETGVTYYLTQTEVPESQPLLSSEGLLWAVKDEGSCDEIEPRREALHEAMGVYYFDFDTQQAWSLTSYEHNPDWLLYALMNENRVIIAGGCFV